MAGYADTRQMIIDTLMGRTAGTEIQPEDHQAFALQITDYVRSVELVAGNAIPISFADADTVPVQPDNGQAVYLSSVSGAQTVTFANFIDQNGNAISVTSTENVIKLITLLWNGQYWSSQVTSVNAIRDTTNGYLFMGVATPSTNPGTPDQKVFYIAGPGTYQYFNSTVISDDKIGVFRYDTEWVIDTLTLPFVNEFYELKDSILGAETKTIDITDIFSASDRLNAFIADDGTITLSGAYFCTQPYLLKAGHTIKLKIVSSHKSLAYTNAQHVEIGDVVNVLTLTYDNDYRVYTTDVDINVVVSCSTASSILDVAPATKGELPKIKDDIESLKDDIETQKTDLLDVESEIKDIDDAINGRGGITDISHIYTAPDRLDAFFGADGVITLGSVNHVTQPYLLKAGHSIWIKGNAGSGRKILATTTQHSVAIGDVVTPLNTIIDESGYAKYTNDGDDMLVVVNSVYNPVSPFPTIIKDIEPYTAGIIDDMLTNYATSTIQPLGNLDVAYPNFDYCHIISYGQSFSEGGGGVGKYDIIPGNYKIGNNIQISGKVDRTQLNGLTSTSNGTIVAQCTNAFSLLWRKYHNPNTMFIASAGGHGGATLNEISKGSVYYTQFLEELTAAKTIANNNGKSIGCIAILFIQGESGAGVGYEGKGGYMYLMNKLKEDMQADIMSIYGQSAKPIFITYQTGYKWIRNDAKGTIPTSQLEYAMCNEDVILGCPAYFAAFTNTNHPSGNGYSMIGEVMSKYLYGIMGNKRLQSIYPYSVTAKGHCINIMCDVTNAPLRVDTHTVSSIPNYGFDVKINGEKTNIIEVRVTGNMVRLVTDGELTGKMVEVSYAINNATNGRGNICDSDDKYMSYQTYGEELEAEIMQDYPVDANGRMLYGRRLPLQNWLGNFYINTRFHFVEHFIRASVNDTPFKNRIVNELGLNITYDSSNTNVANIDTNGEITIVATGYSIIKASVTFDNATYTDEFGLVVK